MNFVESLSKISVGIHVSNVAVIWPFLQAFWSFKDSRWKSLCKQSGAEQRFIQHQVAYTTTCNVKLAKLQNACKKVK